MSRLFGVSIPNSPLIHPRLRVAICYALVQQTMQFNGLYQSWPDIIKLCSNLIVYGIIIQLAVRLVVMIVFDTQKLVDMNNEIIKKFYEREERIEEHRPILIRGLINCEFYMRSYQIMFFFAYHVPILTAIIVSWYSGEFVLFSQIYLPYTDPKTLFGYIVSTVLMLIGTSLGYLINVAGEIGTLYYIYHMGIITDVYKIRLKNFGEKLVKIKKELSDDTSESEPSTSKRVTNAEKLRQKAIKETQLLEKQEAIEENLIVLIKEMKDLTEYMENTLTCIQLTTFIILSANAMAIALSIVAILYFSIFIGCATFFLFFGQTLLFCIKGSFIKHQKEKLLNELWDFPWYELSKSKQKIFLQFLVFCQNLIVFEVYVFGEVSLELFTDVINATYSHLMYLWNFVQL